LKYLGPNGDLDHGPSLDVDLDDGVLSIVLNQPRQGKAIDEVMHLAITRLLDGVSADASVHVVVLRVNGAALPTQGLRLLAQPIIAMVQGPCRADTIAVIEACDIVIAADDADFHSAGQSFDSKEAQRQGLVTLSVPASDLQAHTDTLARELANKDALALRFTKQTLQRVPNIPWDEVLTFTSTKQIELKALQAGQPSARASAIESFLAGKSKPGAGA
jgi:feruloyl-CoA hydratase/lyase